MYNSEVSCKTKVLKVSQEEAFAGENYERRYEVEEGEMVQVAGNKASKTFRSDFDEFISFSIDKQMKN